MDKLMISPSQMKSMIFLIFSILLLSSLINFDLQLTFGQLPTIGKMENEQQVSLAANTVNYRSEKYQQLQQKLANEFKIKNICIVVIIAIIISNYLQVRSLKANYVNSEGLIEEVVKIIQENKQNIEKEVENRISNISQLRNLLEKKVAEIEQTSSSIKKSNGEEVAKFEARLSKLQESILKMRKDLQKHQEAQVSTAQPAEPRIVNSQNLKKQNLIIQFIFNQLKESFHQSKSKWFKSLLDSPTFKDEKAKTAFMTSLANIKLKHENALSQIQNKQNQMAVRNRLLEEYEFDKYQKELPFCIIVPTFNNAKNFRYEYNLQSILNLNYKNYKVVIIDDASTDGTYELLSSLISALDSKIVVHLIRNEMKMTAVPNINRAIREYCHIQDIAVLVDGDDELLVRDSLKVFNSIYQSQKVDVVYSNHLKLYWHQDDVFTGWSSAYTKSQIKQNLYRDVPQKIAHLRSFKASLFLKIKEQDLKDQYGSWFTSTYDEVICLPILEMSCGRIAYVDEYFYLYNYGIGTNDIMVDGKKQKQIADYVKHNKKKYSCLEQV